MGSLEVGLVESAKAGATLKAKQVTPKSNRFA